MLTFIAKIQIIGINPYVLLPAAVLNDIMQKAGKDKGAIPVKLRIGGQDFIQNLVKYSDYALPVLIGKIGTTGKAKAVLKQLFGNSIAKIHQEKS